jgi:hypothetical protein
VPVTGRKVEFALVGVIGFQNGKVASEHLYWDQPRYSLSSEF